MIRGFLGTTLGQILGIVGVLMVATYVMWRVLLYSFYPVTPPVPPRPWPMAYRIAGVVRTLRVVPASDGPAVIAAARSKDIELRLAPPAASCRTLTTARGASDLEAVLRSELPGLQIIARSCASPNPARTIGVLIRLGDRTLDIRTGDVGGNFLPSQFATTVCLLLAVTAILAWAIWRVTVPLRHLSEKADAFGREIAVAPIAEEGPTEIRRVARACNLMQERITQSMRYRTRMLAAISHDLRTPLTRMRLQLEGEPTEVMRGKLLRDVGLMQSMVTSTLAFLSGSFDEEEKEWLDLGVLLATLCDEFEEGGADISYEGPEQAELFCRPNAINRAFTNLIENGIHFGTRVTIRASIDDAKITIDVADEGPGIPAGRMEDVVEPFVRLDPSRSDRPGSVGLGLSIVKEIAEAHQGTLTLINSQPAGLIARLILPTVGKRPLGVERDDFRRKREPKS